MGACRLKAPHHASQFGVELSGKGFNQVQFITSGCFKKHLKWFEPTVCHAVHCETQNRAFIYRLLAVFIESTGVFSVNVSVIPEQSGLSGE